MPWPSACSLPRPLEGRLPSLSPSTGPALLPFVVRLLGAAGAVGGGDTQLRGAGSGSGVEGRRMENWIP